MKWFGKKKKTETGSEVTETTESVTVDNSGVKYIENPLPLPKKHVNKTMDFDIEISENDDFDV
ncbi:MAG: hypothetical protein J6J79_06340 [Lachnospiraceae bacterium]|nr:hypothetical protein [Lachnospiraceae bacterium]